MKQLLFFFLIFLSVQLFGCQNTGPLPSANNTIAAKPDTMKLKITIGTKQFTATVKNNETVKAFKAMLPLSLLMTDLNSNEKYAALSKALPAKASKPATVKAGELMLYGSNTLVLFTKRLLQITLIPILAALMMFRGLKMLWVPEIVP